MNGFKKLIKKINKNKELKWSDIKIIKIDKDENLLQNNYIKIKKETHVQGKKDANILQIDEYYIEISNEG